MTRLKSCPFWPCPSTCLLTQPRHTTKMTIQAWLSIISQVGIQYEKNIPKYAHYWWTVNTYVQNVYAFVCVCVWKTNLCVLVGCAVPRVVPLLLHPQLSLSHAAAHNYWWQRRPGGEEVAATATLQRRQRLLRSVFVAVVFVVVVGLKRSEFILENFES